MERLRVAVKGFEPSKVGDVVEQGIELNKAN
jgi:hypothetical protein